MKFLDRIFSIENKYIGGQNVIVIKLLWIEIIFEVNKHCKVKIKFNSTIEKLKRENRILISENNCFLYNCSLAKPYKDKINVYLLNDTSQYDRNHIGCKCVTKSIKELCLKNGMEIFFYDGCIGSIDGDIEKFKTIIEKCDILILNGEGTLHNEYSRVFMLMNKCLLAKKLGKKLALINTIYQNNSTLHKYLPIFDIISVRESLSRNEILKFINVNIRVVPDLSFYPSYNTQVYRDKSINNVVFTDSVIPTVTTKLRKISEKYNSQFYYMDESNIPKLSLNELMNAGKVVTGRFHCLVLCMKYSIPCLAVKSNTHKIQGILKDAGLCEYLVDSDSDIEDRIWKFMNSDHSNFYEKSSYYSKVAITEIDKLFIDIKDLIQ